MKKIEAIQLIRSYKKYEENIIKVYQTRSCCLEAGVDQAILKSRVPTICTHSRALISQKKEGEGGSNPPNSITE